EVGVVAEGLVGGVRSICVAESVGEADIAPAAPAAEPQEKKLPRLLAAIRLVIERATGARYYLGADGRFNVYDRRGEPCSRCGAPIAWLVQSGRSTYFCPRCQRRARVRKARRANTRTTKRRARR